MDNSVHHCGACDESSSSPSSAAVHLEHHARVMRAEEVDTSWRLVRRHALHQSFGGGHTPLTSLNSTAAGNTTVSLGCVICPRPRTKGVAALFKRRSYVCLARIHDLMHPRGETAAALFQACPHIDTYSSETTRYVHKRRGLAVSVGIVQPSVQRLAVKSAPSRAFLDFYAAPELQGVSSFWVVTQLVTASRIHLRRVTNASYSYFRAENVPLAVSLTKFRLANNGLITQPTRSSIPLDALKLHECHVRPDCNNTCSVTTPVESADQSGARVSQCDNTLGKAPNQQHLASSQPNLAAACYSRCSTRELDASSIYSGASGCTQASSMCDEDLCFKQVTANFQSTLDLLRPDCLPTDPTVAPSRSRLIYSSTPRLSPLVQLPASNSRLQRAYDQNADLPPTPHTTKQIRRNFVMTASSQCPPNTRSALLKQQTPSIKHAPCANGNQFDLRRYISYKNCEQQMHRDSTKLAATSPQLDHLPANADKTSMLHRPRCSTDPLPETTIPDGTDADLSNNFRKNLKSESPLNSKIIPNSVIYEESHHGVNLGREAIKQRYLNDRQEAISGLLPSLQRHHSPQAQTNASHCTPVQQNALNKQSRGQYLTTEL